MKSFKLFHTTLIVLLLISATTAKSQELSVNKFTYKTAAGIRGGGTSGFTVKHFLSSSAALEGILGVHPYWGEGFSATLLYEKHAGAGVSGLRWYYGAGAHITSYRNGTYFHRNRADQYYYTNNEAGIGIDGIVGLEYKIKPIPIAISLDMKPFFEINTAGFGFATLDPALGVKLTF